MLLDCKEIYFHALMFANRRIKFNNSSFISNTFLLL